MRAALLAIEELAGRKAENPMLRFAGLEEAIQNPPPDNLLFDAGYVFQDYTNLNHALIEFYGETGKVHALRIGQASALWMIEHHPIFGFAGVDFSAMPTEKAMRMSLKNTAEGFRKLYRKVHFNIHITLEEQDDHFLWSTADCPCCVGKQASEPICWIWEAGFIAGGQFITGGQNIPVEQVACRACGDAECAWLIGKNVVA